LYNVVSFLHVRKPNGDMVEWSKTLELGATVLSVAATVRIWLHQYI
jgi:hypothetical protein